MTAGARLAEVFVLATRQSYKAGPLQYRLWADGPSVYVQKGNTIRELPRSGCALIWQDTGSAAKGKAKP